MKIKIELITDLLKRERTQKEKIFLSTSIGWIIFIGFLTWLNGLNDILLIKKFKWDEWFWFGIVPATAPYIFLFIWKKKDIDKDQDSSKT
jgi:hypothetical protein